MANCPQYRYPYPAVIVDSGTVPCIGYADATYPNHNDCDYEFCFPAPSKYLTEFPLAGVGPRAKLLLSTGGIEARLDNGQVKFLIGRGRVNTLFFRSPENFMRHIKGGW